MKLTIKVRVARRSQEVRAWVTANGEVARSVHTHEVVGESVLATLHVIPKRLYILAVQQLGNHIVVGPLPGCPCGDVALQAARVVAKTNLTGSGRVCIVENRIIRRASQIREYWSEVH